MAYRHGIIPPDPSRTMVSMRRHLRVITAHLVRGLMRGEKDRRHTRIILKEAATREVGLLHLPAVTHTVAGAVILFRPGITTVDRKVGTENVIAIDQRDLLLGQNTQEGPILLLGTAKSGHRAFPDSKW